MILVLLLTILLAIIDLAMIGLPGSRELTSSTAGHMTNTIDQL